MFRAGLISAVSALAVLAFASAWAGPAALPERPTGQYGLGLSKGRFLVAARRMGDPRFAETVILLVEYSEGGGAMGLIINQPTDTPLSEVFPDMEAFEDSRRTVYYGGPVEMAGVRLLVRSAGPPDPDALRVVEGVYLSDSSEVLERMAGEAEEDGNFRVYAGYAGWSPGQLEHEVLGGSWHVMSADADTVFARDPSKVWDGLIIFGSGMQVRAY